MSDDDRDNDIESDADKRAHHNALERKRRDHIKDSFSMLRDALPYFQGDKVREMPRSFKRSFGNPLSVEDSDDSSNDGQGAKRKKQKVTSKASRAQILKRAADYIQNMRRKNTAHQQDIDDLRKQNKQLEDQIRSLEKAKTTGNYAAAAAVIEHCGVTNNKANAIASYDGDSDSDDSSDNSEESKDSPRKRLKSNADVPLRT